MTRGPRDAETILKIAVRLGELRKHSKTTWTALATAIGVSKSTMSDYQKGKIPLSGARIEQLAAAMHVDPKHLHDPPGSPLPKFRVKRRTKSPSPPDISEARPPIQKIFISHSLRSSAETERLLSSILSSGGHVRDAWNDFDGDAPAGATSRP
jgi:transcriptional regulator with XRE-family HTH domain